MSGLAWLGIPSLISRVWQSFPIEDDLNPRFPMAALDLMDLDGKVDRLHDVVAKMLVHPPLNGRPIHIHGLM